MKSVTFAIGITVAAAELNYSVPMNFKPLCNGEDDLTISVSATADNEIVGAWIDGVSFDGLVGSRHNHQHDGFHDFVLDRASGDCKGDVCHHVLAIEAKDEGIIAGFIAVLKVNGYTYQTGVDPFWRGALKEHRQVSASAIESGQWKLVDFDDNRWAVPNNPNDALCMWPDRYKQEEYKLGARWIDPHHCRRYLKNTRYWRFHFLTANCVSYQEQVLNKYYGDGNGGCFKYNVKWPCRGCISYSDPNGPIPDAAAFCKNDNIDSTPLCMDGYQPCQGDTIPKCYPVGGSKDGYCEPIPGTMCGGSANNNNNNNNNGGVNGGSNAGESNNSDNSNDSSSGNGSGSGNNNNNDDDSSSAPGVVAGQVNPDDNVENPNQSPAVPTPPEGFEVWPSKPCPTCAGAFFKCRPAMCADWDCKWWCRCYQEDVDYECEDDNDSCDCSAFSNKELYNVTFEDLIYSQYMEVRFYGHGADELNRLAQTENVLAN
jgi:hypothetical protein